MFLQLLAKAHEILIVGSLGQIILQSVRHELLFGDGLPLGLIGSGISFSDFAFFFKREFWGAVGYVARRGGGGGSRKRRVGFVGLVVGAGITAVLAGPASAVLLVPKDQSFPSGRTDFYLPGEEEELFPKDLSGSMAALHPFCDHSTSTAVAICPASGFLSLLSHWSTSSNPTSPLPLTQANPPAYAAPLSGSHFYFPVSSPSSPGGIPSLYSLGNLRPDNSSLLSQSFTFLVQTHAASAVVLNRLATDWWGRMREKIDPLRISDRNVKGEGARGAIVGVRCAGPREVVVEEGEGDRVVQFPTMRERFDWAESWGLEVDALNSTAADADAERLRFRWVHLPASFGALSIGAVAVFESPGASDSKSRTVIGCSAQSGWVPVQMLSDQYAFWTGFYPFNIGFGERTPAWVAGSEAPTNGRIALGDEWLGLLTPPAPAIGSENSSQQISSSTIETILTAAGLADPSNPSAQGTSLTADWIESDILPNAGKTRLLEAIISSVLADGLSRSGSHLAFNTTSNTPPSSWDLSSTAYAPIPSFNHTILQPHSSKPSLQKPPSTINYTTLHATFSITGYSFRITLAGYLAMVVLLTHMVLAWTHVVWVLGFGKRTSRSWGSVAEWIALAQNGRGRGGGGGGGLVNVGGGIGCVGTFVRVAKVRVRSDGDEEGGEHVELIFEEVGDRYGVDGNGGGMGCTSGDDDGLASGVKRASTISHNAFGDSGNAGRVSWTFPLDASRSFVQRDVELQSQSSATERLIPRVHLADDDYEKKGGIVRVNQAYG
ncbi:MAG: hypothetical protein Q9160_004874 [Pyrenula sp. 1 TL-2023]